MKTPSASKKNVSDVLGVIFTHRLVVQKRHLLRSARIEASSALSQGRRCSMSVLLRLQLSICTGEPPYCKKEVLRL